jgi:galactonate dehydratase
VQVAPHNAQGPLSTAAHLAMAIPNFLSLEYVRQEPYRDQLLREAWMVENGHLHVPDRPGLGGELDEEAIAANPYRPRPARRNACGADGAVADI